jgi:pimeloyl-ACP methyl ester carboxylesterase
MFVTTNGVNTYVERLGAGKPLVLIHGLGTPSVWMHVQQQLSQSFDVIIVHLPGFGLSDPPTSLLTTEDHAHLIKEVLDKLQVQQVSIAGISYGGQVAATFCQFYPEHAERLVLICSSGLMKRFQWLRFPFFRGIISAVAALSVFRSKTLVRLSNRVLYYNPQKQPPEIVSQFYNTMQQKERRASWFQCAWNAAYPAGNFPVNLSTLNIPTLILWGRNDRVIPVKHASEFQQRIKESELKIFEECGHALPVEEPGELSEEVSRFLKK